MVKHTTSRYTYDNTTEQLADLSPVDIYAFATRHENRSGRFYHPFTRHKTKHAAIIFAATHPGEVTFFEFDFDKEEWVEVN